MVKTLSNQTLKKNDIAPPFRLMGTDNKFYSDQYFNGKCLLVIFICNHCPYVIDDTQEIAKSYGAVCTPDPFLFDQNRRLVFHGKINDAMEPEMTPQEPVMENNIRRVLKGETIEKEFDPSIGCSIKWKS